MRTALSLVLSLALAAAPLAACDDTSGGGSPAGADADDASADAPAGDTSAGDAEDDTGPAAPLPTVAGCGDTLLLESPEDPAAPGPWPVGARTVTIPGNADDPELTVEVWYPAVPGSDEGLERAVYDVREHLPEGEGEKIPDEENPWQPCACTRDLPLDTARGPYPAVLFIHGTAGFRTQSLTQNVHWASRGFVVLSADHPGMYLADILGFTDFGNRMVAQGGLVLDALEAGEGDLAFLAGHVDLARLGVTGHSAGGGAASGLAGRAGVQVVIPMAAGNGPSASDGVASTLFLAGAADGLVTLDSVVKGYDKAAPSKRLVALAGAGHLAFSDLCALGRDQGGVLRIAQDNGIEVPDFIVALASDGCLPENLSPEAGWAITDAASSAALEETLHCSASATARLAGLQAAYPDVSDYRADLAAEATGSP